MTPLQVKSEILRLRGEGRSLNEISVSLAKEGIKGSRSGKPLSVGTISHMIKNSAKRAPSRGKEAAKKAHPQKQRGRLDAIRSILKLKMDAEEKIALALLVID